MLSQNAYLDADASVSSGAAEKRRSAHHLRRPRCSCFGKCSLESATPKVELWKCNSSKAFLEACGILPMSTFECSVLFDVYFRVLNLFWHLFYSGQYLLTSVHNAHCFFDIFSLCCAQYFWPSVSHECFFSVVYSFWWVFPTGLLCLRNIFELLTPFGEWFIVFYYFWGVL